ncbi:exonuclease domain-containing protein [Marinimicrobium sp. C6131]|uniref:exonuclease domain-containing protein n=1 Tax=Marinimicrobium sp. C6131 TaxID=3022676 RepID=UPI00223D3DF6|nr:exonuclease domain-containing protein [Marinimicrobium sp. C6131]UZJ44224.1 exonuclease domain-containing protein [Marinimicrobium sp. C6131]
MSDLVSTAQFASRFPGLDRPLAIVDIETTGGSVTRDRITEIGIVEVDENGVREWSTLINPGMAIPPTIQRFTGITDAMVADAPRFEQVAKAIFQRLERKVFVAHNVRFDYGFLHNAFASLGFPLSLELLCTVKLSRALYPEHRRHSLEMIIQRFGIETDARHRALADARATYTFLCRAAAERSPELFMQAVQAQTRRPSIPPGLDPACLDRLPNGPGVYYFYGENNSLLYVGKSVDVRKRVMSHFTADRASARGMAMCQQVRDIQVQPTTGELSALLLEAEEIKTRQPLFNRRLRRVSTLYTLQLHKDAQGVLRPEIMEAPSASRDRRMYGLFPSKKKARNALIDTGKQFGLCDHVIITPAPLNSPCMGRQLKHCKGLCTGDWSAAQHNVSLMDALGSLALKAWPYPGPAALIEYRNPVDEASPHTLFLLDNWCVLATLKGRGEPDWEQLETLPTKAHLLDKDIYRYLLKVVSKPPREVRWAPLTQGGQPRNR